MQRYFYYLVIFVLFSCKNTYYTLSGATATGTIQVVNFSNLSGGGPPYLAQKLTEDLKTYYLQNSRLRIVNAEADYIVEGDITGYQVLPLAPTAQERAAQTRINITVKVRFTDNKEPTNSFEQNFTQFADFPENQSLAQAENQKVQEIFDKLIFDIFQKTVANW